MRIPGPDGMLVLSVHGRLDAAEPKPLFLFLEGWAPRLLRPISPADRTARWLARETGVLSATVFLTGMGSPGRVAGLTQADFLRQALAGYDRLVEHPGVSGVSVVGSSFGGYLACLLTSKRPVDRLVLKVPTDLDPFGFETRPQTQVAGTLGRYWKTAAHEPRESLALTAAAAYAGPVWLISAGRDEVVPWQTTQNYLNAFNPERTSHVHVPQGDHLMLGQESTVREVLAEAVKWRQ